MSPLLPVSEARTDSVGGMGKAATDTTGGCGPQGVHKLKPLEKKISLGNKATAFSGKKSKANDSEGGGHPLLSQGQPAITKPPLGSIFMQEDHGNRRQFLS